MKDKLDELEQDLVEVQRSFNQIFAVISKCLRQLDEGQRKVRELKEVFKEAGVER